MMKNPRNLLIFAVLGGIVGTGFGFAAASILKGSDIDPNAEADIRQVLEAQVDAWNGGDIEGYMASYLKGDSLRFASGGNVENGWQSTLDRYKRRYPDRAAMGTLITVDKEVNVIDSDDAFVFGEWALERDGDRPNGLYTLHLKKIDGDWVIISDHTSSAD